LNIFLLLWHFITHCKKEMLDKDILLSTHAVMWIICSLSIDNWWPLTHQRVSLSWIGFLVDLLSQVVIKVLECILCVPRLLVTHYFDLSLEITKRQLITLCIPLALCESLRVLVRVYRVILILYEVPQQKLPRNISWCIHTGCMLIPAHICYEIVVKVIPDNHLILHLGTPDSDTPIEGPW
jgi:hypothetical protein